MSIKSIFNQKYLPFLVLVTIISIGAYLRFYHISQYMTFLGDEGRDMLIVKRMIVDHKFTLLGPTSSVGGFFLGPIYYYFMLPFLWLWQLDPTGPSVMVALFGVATIYLVYILGKKIFNLTVGLIAAALYSISPLVVAYSHSSWNPNVVPFFSTLLIYQLLKISENPLKRNLLAIGIILGIGIQLHYVFLFLYILTILWMIFLSIPNRILKFRHYLFVGLGTVIGMSPFMLFEVRHGFPNIQSIFRFLLAGNETGFVFNNFLVNISDVFIRLFSRLILRIPDSGVLKNIPIWQSYWWINGSIILTLICVCWILYQSIKIINREYLRKNLSVNIKNHRLKATDFGIILIALWVFVVVILFGLYRKPIYDYYLGLIFAAPFILVAYLLESLFKIRVVRWLAFVFLVFLLWLNWQGRPFIYPPNNQLGQTKKIAEAALAKTEGKPFNFALITGSNSDHAYRYFFEILGNTPVTIENFVLDPNRTTVKDQLIVICEETNCQPLGNSLWEIAGFGRAEITGVWDVPFVKIYKLVHYKI
jgi:4-amino-4-deoxy-L-arabinose transferase-like glycosyltransferase